jgi:hypothetical protein
VFVCEVCDALLVSGIRSAEDTRPPCTVYMELSQVYLWWNLQKASRDTQYSSDRERNGLEGDRKIVSFVPSCVQFPMPC